MEKREMYIEIHDGYEFALYTGDTYLRSRKKINGVSWRLHRYIWTKHYGSIPKGMQVHHKDRNPLNNDIDNLELVSAKEHLIEHLQDPGRLDKHRQSLSIARKEAVKWHKSEEGRKWHSIQAKELAERRLHTIVCKECGKEADSRCNSKEYCSVKCYQKAHYKRKPNVKANCSVCNSEFERKKGSTRASCSKECHKVLLEQRRMKTKEAV